VNKFTHPAQPLSERPALARPLPTTNGSAEDTFVVRSGLTKSEAEDLLDWLEVRGCTERELSYHPAQGFVVRFRPPCGPNCPS
jgi:hypothetical protein